ncbi:MAG: hypothetical protein ACJAX0_001214 [Flavobacteriales bacterium]|jgi:hypothetical protein
MQKKRASRTNSTFGFLPTHKPTQKKPKELFFCQRSTEYKEE